MKVKEIDRTANIAWSPAAHHPIYLAAGTAAQQLDATFSTTASLEIYSLNLTEPGLDMSVKGSVVSDFRFHKVVWGSEGMKTSELSSGILVGGTDGGNILVYDPAKLLEGETALLYHKTKHTGPVHSLDFNKFQLNLLASGASDSEIFIWDLNNPTTPMTPGAKSQPAEEVTCVAWNCQVQHILASTFPARCVVWDLRKNEPIIKVSDTTSRIRCKMVAWHPEVATQLCLASEDDHSPFIQLWDLRFATSPLKTLEHHQRGVLSIAWCPQDPDLLLSCGKDNRILCWNPNSNVESGEVVCELPTSNQWSFDVAWCPRNPAVIASSSFDGHVSVFSLMGGQQQAQCSSKIAESFPGSDKFIQPPLHQPTQRHVSISLQKPPKWLRKPVGASFGFGGKLVSFDHQNAVVQPAQSVQQPVRSVTISQVVTEQELLNKSTKLESALNTGNLAEFCQNKVDTCSDKYEKMSWNFLQATFDPSPRTKMLSLLGYDPQNVISQVTALIKDKGSEPIINETDELVNKMSGVTNLSEDIPTGDNISAFDTIAAKTKETDETPFIIKTDKDETDGLLNQALLTGNIEAAVDLCLRDSRWADALVLAQAGGQMLLQKTQKLYFKAVATNSSKLISAVVTSDWAKVVKTCDIDYWKEALAAILTYAKPEEFASLCESLGSRLEVEKAGVLVQNAILCYICAGNLERLSQCWVKTQDKYDISTSLEGLVEQIMILRRAVEQLTGQAPPLQTGTLSALLGQYAALLAAQGSLTSAVTYLVDANEKTLAVLRDRIYQSLGHQSPHFPFQRVEVKGTEPVSVQQPPTAPMESKASFQPQPQTQLPSYAAATSTVPPPNYSYTSNSNISQYQQPVSAAPPTPVSCAPLSPTVPIPPAVPPATDQVASSAGKSHLSQRYPRHLHDPSVYSETAYTQQYYQQQPYPASQQQSFPVSQQQSFPVSQQQLGYNQQNFSQPQTALSYYSTEQNGAPPTYTMANTAHSSYNSGSYNTAGTPASLSTASVPPPPSPAMPMGSYTATYLESKPGWNDPPPLKSATSKLPPGYESPAPITTPITGACDVMQPPPQPLPGTAPGGYFVPSYPPQTQQMQSQGIPSPAPVPLQSMQPQGTQVVPDPPKEKGPIPPEHQVLQDIFEDLRQQCQQVATNPQTRRKLEDVAKKLENLYDKLRDNMLSNPVILGLHQIIQAIQQSDYQGALAIHGQLVSTANFSEISAFMPSVKVLLQTAYQHGVYLQ